MNSRFVAAMTAYAALAVLGGFFLKGQIRAALWIFLGGLAAKTVIVVMSHRED
jgi:hypothetical protein